ncbi:MAG: hypothetical protein ACI87E_004538, partial [Mariniblastus sp.]
MWNKIGRFKADSMIVSHQSKRVSISIESRFADSRDWLLDTNPPSTELPGLFQAPRIICSGCAYWAGNLDNRGENCQHDEIYRYDT